MVRLTDRPDMTLDVYRGRKTTIQQQQPNVYVKQQYTQRPTVTLNRCKTGIVAVIFIDSLPFQCHRVDNM